MLQNASVMFNKILVKVSLRKKEIEKLYSHFLGKSNFYDIRRSYIKGYASSILAYICRYAFPLIYHLYT